MKSYPVKYYNIALASLLVLFLASCASKKTLADASSKVQTSAKTSHTSKSSAGSQTSSSSAKTDVPDIQSLAFAQKVSDRQVYAKNIVGHMSFNIKAGGKDITLPGSLHMRKNEVVRIQLLIPILGSEIGRLEFTPDYVLIVDRLHKQYVKADYSQVDFLKKQGLSFYSLQAMFWNQLLLPGKNNVSESDLKQFSVNTPTTGSNATLSYSANGMTYKWTADKTSGQINAADVVFKSKAYGTSTLNWKYSNFVSVGVKLFPATQNFSLKAKVNNQQQTVEVGLELDEVKTDEKWDATTSLSSKYKQVSVEDVLGSIINAQ